MINALKNFFDGSITHLRYDTAAELHGIGIKQGPHKDNAVGVKAAQPYRIAWLFSQVFPVGLVELQKLFLARRKI